MYRNFSSPKIKINLSKRTLFIMDELIKTTPSELGYYLWFCLRRTRRQGMVVFDENDYTVELIRTCRKIEDGMSANIQNLKDLQREVRKIDRGADQFQLQKDRFAPHRTRLNQSICRSLGEKARPFLIQTVQRKPWVGYELICDPDSIKIDP